MILPPNLSRLRWWSYAPLASFPHLGLLETKIWREFLRQYPLFFDRVTYDVGVGETAPTAENETDNYVRMVKRLSEKRIDVVATKQDMLYLVEIKHWASSVQLGQLLIYKSLFQQRFPDAPVPNLLILCQMPAIDLFSEAGKQNIQAISISLPF